MNKMLQVKFSRTGGPEVMELLPLQLPQLQKDDVSVKIGAIGLNRFEALYRRNFYVIPPTLPSTMGVEAVGTVMELGSNVKGLSLGTRVTILPIASPVVGTGTYATHANVPASAIVPSIDGTTDIEEAAIWMASLQAFNLITKKRLGKGDAVLITAGTSSVGTALIQMARDMGVTVFATSRKSLRKSELLDRGADYAVATDDEDVVQIIDNITKGRGVSIAYDTVGGTVLAQCLASVSEGGSVFSYGAQSSTDFNAACADVPLGALDRRYLTFVDLFELIGTPDRFAAAKAYIPEAYSRGVLKPWIDSTFSLSDIQNAHRRMEDGSLNGKVVVITT